MIVHQDNESTIKLVENGNANKGKSRHIQLRHFWMIDYIKNGEIRLAYLCTEEMIADVLTKPLVSKLFMKFRTLLGIKKA